jgi:hypothetical protein
MQWNKNHSMGTLICKRGCECKDQRVALVPFVSLFLSGHRDLNEMAQGAGRRAQGKGIHPAP